MSLSRNATDREFQRHGTLCIILRKCR